LIQYRCADLLILMTALAISFAGSLHLPPGMASPILGIGALAAPFWMRKHRADPGRVELVWAVLIANYLFATMADLIRS